MLDLAKLHQYKENNRLEAKKAQGGLPHSIWETYSAFANTFGGYILLGVIETGDKSFASVPLPSPEKLVEAFWAGINNRAVTNVNILAPQHVQIQTSDDNRIVVIEVPRADRRHKPVYIGTDPFTGTYRRSGEGDYRCTREEVCAMLRDQADDAGDTRVLDALPLSALSRDALHRYRSRTAETQPCHPWAGLTDADFLCRIGAAAPDTGGTLRPTAAGLLMFGHEPDIRREFPHYLLEYRAYGHTGQETGRVLSLDGDWSGNVFDFYEQVYAQMLANMDPSLHKGLREALANALIHADYQDRRGLIVEQWPDRIRIANPGAFRISVQQALAGGVSDPRNRALTGMFHMIGAGEGDGSGLAGIRAAWQRHHHPAPRITESFGPDRTTLLLPLTRELTKRRSAEQRKADILQYLTDTPQATSAQIAQGVGLSVPRTRKYLAVLTKEGAVETDSAHCYRLCS